jgi:hypothetical protein
MKPRPILARLAVPAFAALWIGVATPASATDYYVSVTGVDSRDGTSPATAWRTIQRVNNQRFAAGDRILFEAGQTFSGNLYFDGAERGTSAAPIVVSSYGAGRATIYAADGDGILLYQTAGYEITNLYVVGSGSTTNVGNGIFFDNDLPGDVLLPYVRIDRVDAVRFGESGILIGGDVGASGYKDVRITNVIASDNRMQGIFVYAAQPNVHQGVYIGTSQSFRNSGMAGLAFNSGNGITVSGVDGGTIERCIAHDNGWLSDASNGPIGIWTFHSTRVVIQYNESYANKTGGTKDGGGFSLDQSTSNSLLQYNYSHDNAGAGLLLAHKPDDLTHSGNVVRYNVSQNDARRNNYAAFHVWGRIRNAEVYNNTVYVKSSSTGAPRAVYIKNLSIETHDVQHLHIRNNLFVTTSTVRLVEVTATQLDGAVDLRFENNAYFSSGATPRYVWGATTHSSLAAWRLATGQEQLGAAAVGYEGDPMLEGPGSAGTIGDTMALNRLEAYRLRAGSPLIDRGLNLETRYGLDAGAHDFYDVATPRGAGFDIGAQEFDIDCAWSVAPAPLAFTADGGTMSATISTNAASCGWTARANHDWVYVVPPTTGMGDGFVTVGTTANPLATSRTGTVTIGLQTIAVTQPAGAASSNQPPSVTLTQPSNGAAVDAGSPVTISATATDADGSVSRVDFLANGALIGSTASAPYVTTWSPGRGGTFTLVARATDNSGAATASSGVTITVGGGSSAVPAPWTETDIGAVGVPGGASYNAGSFSVSGSGADIWGSADAFHFVYQPMSGDGELVARVAFVSNTDVWTKAGIMMRAGLGAGAQHVSAFATPGKGLVFQYRPSTGGTSTSVPAASGTAPAWFRLVRIGSTFTSYRSNDGAAWTKIGSASIVMGATIYVGLALTSHNNAAAATASIDNVAGGSGAGPAPTWQDRDIGSVGQAGSASESGGTFTLKGAGADIWGAADSFHFMYQPMRGDGQIVARVASLTHTHDWAKAGVMIRETLTAGSKHVSVFATPAKGTAFQRRPSTGGVSATTAGVLAAPPRWVKLVRTGATIAAFESADGTAWALVGSESISMAADVYVGLAVTSHTTAALATAAFESVAKQP